MRHLLPKCVLATSGAVALSALGLLAASSALQLDKPIAPAQAPALVADYDELIFHGSVEYADRSDWSMVQKYGIYKFTLGTSPVAEGPVSETHTNGGGFYLDGYYYCLSGWYDQYGQHNRWIKYNTETWEIEFSKQYDEPTLTDASALAYDYIGHKAYAVGINRNNRENPYDLRTVDIATGEMTNVGSLDQRFPGIAVDAQGQLWGIARDTKFPQATALYKIDKNTGATTKVGDTGYNQKSDYCGLCFDHRTGKLYWTTRTYTYNSYYEESYLTGLFEIDTTTGAATLAKNFPENEVFSSLYLVDSHPKAPAPVADLKFVYTDGKTTEGNVEFTFPSKYYDGTAIPSGKEMTYELYLDGKPVASRGPQYYTPGQSFRTSAPLTLSEGKHTVKAYVIARDLPADRSIPAYIGIFGGDDLPSPVTNLRAEYTPHRESVTLTWDAPTGTVNGGVFDPADVTYKIMRAPGLDVIAEGLKECTFTDTPDYVQTFSQYRVIAVTPNGESTPVYTTAATIGQPRTLPYLETFDSQSAFNTFTVLDPQGIASSNGDTFMWHPQFYNAIYWLNYDYYNKVNAWLVTPTIKFRDGYVYRVSFDSRGYSSIAAQTRMEIKVGEFPTEESLTREIYSEDYTLPIDQTKNFATLFTGKSTDYHIGFHVISDGQDHISIDNLRVLEYGPVQIPAAPTLVSIEEDGEQVAATVKLPTLDAEGKPVSKITRLSMYTSNRMRLISRVDVPDGTTQLTIKDPSPTFGDNNYVIMAENEYGLGLELFCSINTKPAVPKNVEGYTLSTASDGRDALLTWNYPEDMLGVDGKPLTTDQLSYDIYRYENFNYTLVTTLSGDQTSVVIPDIVGTSTERQLYATFSVVARTLGGESEHVSQTALFGAAYELPVHETFTGDFKPWNGDRSILSSFSNASNVGYDPRCEATEGRVLSFIPSSSQALGVYVSPRFNLTSLKNPVLTFSVYCSPDQNLANATVQIGLVPEVDGIQQDLVLIPGIYKVQADQAGWKQIEVDLSDFADLSRASVVLRCISSSTKGCIHFDYIDITGDKPDLDARATSISGPYTALLGRDNAYNVTVENNGTRDLQNVTVTLLADGETIEAKNIDLNEGETYTVPFIFKPALDESDRNVTLRATVSVEGDENRFNDSQEMRIRVEAPNLPYVTDLQVNSTEQGIHLFWSDAQTYPYEVAVTDDIENYPDFAIENIGAWTLLDLDKATTMPGISSSMGSFTWNHAGDPQAYIVFNPKNAGVSLLATAHSGDRCLVSFPSADVNNDWLISPPLSGHAQTISFYTKAMLGSQFAEKYSVMISRSGNDPADFTPLRENITLTSESWLKQSFQLPAGTRYFAIVCQSENAFGFMLDDFEYVPAQPDVELTGYNVYRDKKLLVEGLGETEHIDTDFDPDTNYLYHVTATYTDGESIFSNPVEVVYSSVNTLPADAAATIFANAGRIIVKAPAGAPVTVHTLDGRCLYSFASTGIESMSVPAGIYIVRAGTATAKLIVK